MNNGNSFSKIRKPAQPDGGYAITICSCFGLMRDWKLENLANGKDISTVSFGMEKDFEWIFRKIGVLTIWPKHPEISVENEMEQKFLWKIRSEIVDYLQR